MAYVQSPNAVLFETLSTVTKGGDFSTVNALVEALPTKKKTHRQSAGGLRASVPKITGSFDELKRHGNEVKKILRKQI